MLSRICYYTMFNKFSIRIYGRIDRELKKIKQKFPLVISSEDMTVFVVTRYSDVRQGKAITMMMNLPSGWPFKAPIVQVAGYQVSMIKDWHVQMNLVDIFSHLLKDVKAAERDPLFRAGEPYEQGEWFTVQNSPTPVVIGKYYSCHICSNLAKSACACCKTPLCSQKCQKQLHQ